MKSVLIITLLLVCSVAGAQEPSLIIPVGHTNSVLSGDISPDGQKYLNSSYDGQAKIWNRNGFELYAVHGFDRFANQVSFSKTGEYFLVRYEKTVAVYNVQTGQIVSTFTQSTGIESACFTKTGDKILFTTYLTAGLFDALTGEMIYEDDHITEKIIATELSGDGSNLAILRENEGITVQEPITNGVSEKFSIPGLEFTCISLSPDGKYIASGSTDGHLRVWSIENKKLVVDRRGHTERIISVRYNKEGTRLVSAGEDEVIVFWDPRTGDSLHRITGTHNQYGAFFNPASDKVLSYASWEVQIWDPNTGSLIYELDGYRHTGSRNDVDLTNIKHAAFSPDGNTIITSSSDCTSIIWDAKTGAFLKSLKGEVVELTSQVYSKKNKILVTGQIDGSVRFWKTGYGQLIRSSNEHDSWITEISLSPDESKVATVSKSGQLSTWDISSGALLNKWEAHANWIVDVQFSSDGKKLITGSWDNTAGLWDVATGKLLLRMNKHHDNVEGVDISHDGKFALTASWDSSIQIWGTTNGKLFKKFRAPEGLAFVRISLDNKFVVAGGDEGTVYGWDIVTGKLLYTTHFGTQVVGLELTEDGKKVNVLFSGNSKFSNDRPGQFAQYDIATGKVLIERESPGENGDLVSFSLDDYNKQFLLAASNGKVTLHNPERPEETEGEVQTNSTGWNNVFFTLKNEFAVGLNFGVRVYKIVTGTDSPGNAGTIKEVYTSIALDTIDYLTYIPSGYYQCSPTAAKLLHYVSSDMKVITFDQLDVKYNRPDKVLEAIGNTDTALIRSYRKAWEKRIRKLAIDTSTFRPGYSIPAADFTNRADISYEQKNDNLSLYIRGDDSIYKLDRFNIWINELPLYGQRGISIRQSNRNALDTTISVILSEGENRIEASITNVNGTESYRMPLIISHVSAVKPVEHVHFIGIGMDRFENAQYNLQYSGKDIRDFAAKLRERFKDSVSIDTLFNEQVSIESVKALKEKLKHTRINDKVIIAYSGHGMLSKDYDYYLSTYSVNFDKPEENGLPYDELENLLDSIPARKKLLLIDACHSGEVDKEDLVTIEGSSDSLIKGFKPVAYKKEGQLGLKNSFELMQSLFVNVGKSTGATIISAAAGTQFALERNDLKNGVFTYAILEAMNKYTTLKISELKKIVGERVEELTKGLQKPTSRNETIAVDWSIW